MQLIFEKSIPGRTGFQLPRMDAAVKAEIPPAFLRKHEACLPEVSELDVVRHFTRLSQQNYSVDSHFYPLGSCTMKYNPKFTEVAALFPGFTQLHPLLPQLPEGEKLTQGALEILYEMDRLLCEITGMDAFTLQPLAGAHGELTGVMMMAAYHKAKGNKKRYIIIPDTAHGTNPSSATIAGYETLTVASDENGIMDMQALKAKISPEVAGLMLTCPNTLGLFDPHIAQICQMIHEVDGLTYYDGANLNAILGRCRPGDIGFDIVHINLHKTFATPHGGGGPGAGPVGVKQKLEKFLPVSRVVKRPDMTFALEYSYPDSIGYIASFYGNFSVILKAFAYILLLGREGLLQTSNHAVLNANYIKERMKDYFEMASSRRCMHEFVCSASRQAVAGVHALDIAKFLIDKGIHPPTVYFPLTVKEAIMIEPTETESKQTMDLFIQAMGEAARLAEENPGLFAAFPQTTVIHRPDEVKAARELHVNYFAQIKTP
jgi:glycine dehydrogenase subunit 2